MKKVLYTAVLICSFCLLVGCGMNADELILDNLEGEINSTTVDYGSAKNSSLKVEADVQNKTCGHQSLRLVYELNEDGYMYAARGYGLDALNANKWSKLPEKIDWRSYQAFRFSVYGRNNGIVAFDIKDAGGEMWRHEFNVDFEGWKDIIIPYLEFENRKDWQPQTAILNGVLEFPLKSYQWEPKRQGENKINFDCVKLIRLSSTKK